MYTPPRAHISRVEAPSKPRAAKISSAAARMRALVEPGASRALSSALFITGPGRLIRAFDPGPSTDQALADGKPDELGRVVQVELLHEVLAVGLAGVDAPRQRGGALLVGLALGDQLQHLAFAVGQEREIVLDLLTCRIAQVPLEQNLRDHRAEERSTAPDHLDGLQQIQILG